VPASDNASVAPAQSWWHGLQRRHAGQNIEFRDGEISDETALPRELFDSAADNLIQNALRKRTLQGDFTITVSFACGEHLRMEVCDAGHAVAAQIAAELLRGPVPSETGLGIGLYQVARHAEGSGFTLALAHNEDGKVSFVLADALKPAAEPPAGTHA
jgi:signal transduction histidine kinase